MSGANDIDYAMLFAHPEMVRDLLAGFTPFSALGALDVSAYERINASYVSDRGTVRRDDMVWRLHLDGQSVLVYLLLEFQARPDPWMALRKQVYVGLLYQDLVKRHVLTADARLPPVLPLVLYNGVPPWRGGTDLSDLCESLPVGLAPFQPAQRFCLIDQRGVDLSGDKHANNAVAAIFRLELSRSETETRAAIAGLGRLLEKMTVEPMRHTIVEWVKRLVGRNARKRQSPVTLNFTEVADMLDRGYATWADRWEDTGRKKGIAQGRAEVLEEATVTARQLLKSILYFRFGTLPVDALEIIDGADLVKIKSWTEPAWQANSLAEVLHSSSNA